MQRTRVHHAFLSLFFALATAFAVGPALAQTEARALQMVQALGLGKNLEAMSYKVAKVSQTHLGVASKVGPQKADQWLREELIATVPKYQDRWDRNLAQAWAPLLTAEELESVATKKRGSPHFAKFMSLRNQAGAAMQAKSQALLATVVAEALKGELAKVPSK